jgi:hypothetical protein
MLASIWHGWQRQFHDLDVIGELDMNLLYCQNGAVVAYHDSNLSSVPASSYGGGVRIIPYDQPLTTLGKFGPAPPVGTRDNRLYAQPTETPALLIAFSGQVRFDQVVAGITWNSIPVATDRMSQLLIANLAQYAATLVATTLIDFTQNGVHYQFQASQAADLNNQVNAFVQQCRTIEASCIADQNLATPTMTTYAQIEAKFGVAPTLTSISPTTYVHGTATVITATGSNFASTSQIVISGTAETTTFVSATQLTATAPATLAAGTYDVTVQNANGFSSSAQTLTLT